MRNSYSPAFAALASPASGLRSSATHTAPTTINTTTPAHQRLDMASPLGNLPHSTPRDENRVFGNRGWLMGRARSPPVVHVRRASVTCTNGSLHLRFPNLSPIFP